MAGDAAGIGRTEFTGYLGTPESAFRPGKFKQEELETILVILGCKYFSDFKFPDGLTIR